MKLFHDQFQQTFFSVMSYSMLLVTTIIFPAESSRIAYYIYIIILLNLVSFLGIYFVTYFKTFNVIYSLKSEINNFIVIHIECIKKYFK
jgi:hypothetical protein